jgi:hypothetical protein
MFGDKKEMREFGDNALKFAVENYSKDKLMKRKMEILKMLGQGEINLAEIPHTKDMP